MRHRTWQRAVWVLFVIGLSVGCAQSQEKGKDDKPRDGTRMLKIIDQELLSRIVSLASSAKTCDTETQIVCVIEMKMITYQGKDYCVAVAPDVQVKTDSSGGFFNKRRIVWKLDADKLTTSGGVDKDLAFQSDAGVVLALNKFDQVDLWGKLGDGSGGPAQRIFFHTRTVRNVKYASATYLPVILWGPSETAELCAAVDPKIVNV